MGFDSETRVAHICERARVPQQISTGFLFSLNHIGNFRRARSLIEEVLVATINDWPRTALNVLTYLNGGMGDVCHETVSFLTAP